MRFESAFGTVFTRTRASEYSALQSFFPRNQMFSSLESPLPKSRQQTIRIILQFSTPLNQVNHCLNGLNNGKKRTSKLSTSTSCSLNKQNVQLLYELRVRYSYASHKLPPRFRYFRYVGYKPENTSATIWTNE